MRVVSSLLKKAFYMLPDSALFPITSGPLKGLRWTPKSANPGQLFGRYEASQEQVLIDLLSNAKTFWDVGAHVGWYSLLAARVMPISPQIVAFEPNPSNQLFLRQHVAQNSPDTITIVPVALGAEPGTLLFSGSNQQGRISDTGELQVEVMSADALLADGLPVPDVLKIDIEGAELDFIRGAQSLLTQHRPTMVLSTHGHRMRDQCRDALVKYGYAVELISANKNDGDYVFVAQPKAIN